MLSLAEAWHWVQIGFCAAVGASVVIASIGVTRGADVSRDDATQPPHCSRCCPNPDDERGMP